MISLQTVDVLFPLPSARHWLTLSDHCNYDDQHTRCAYLLSSFSTSMQYNFPN